MSIESVREIGDDPGAPARHVDLATATLDRLAADWRRLQKTRKQFAQYDFDPTCKGCRDGIVLPAKAHKPYCLVAGFALNEARVSAHLTKALRAHPLWPWLEQFPGLGGGHTALVIGRIGDPRRFPGQRCSEGHYLPPGYPVGSPCPITVASDESERRSSDGASLPAAETSDESARVASGMVHPGTDESTAESVCSNVCSGVMLPPRPGTGTRSLWHYAGLAPGPDGRAMRKRKGVQASWDPLTRTSVMQPSGIAEQIVRNQVPHYVDVYAAKKALLLTRVPANAAESKGASGDAGVSFAPDLDLENVRLGGGDVPERTAEGRFEIADFDGRPLRLIEADRIARTYAAKQFLADLLHEWKRLLVEEN